MCCASSYEGVVFCGPLLVVCAPLGEPVTPPSIFCFSFFWCHQFPPVDLVAVVVVEEKAEANTEGLVVPIVASAAAAAAGAATEVDGTFFRRMSGLGS